MFTCRFCHQIWRRTDGFEIRRVFELDDKSSGDDGSSFPPSAAAVCESCLLRHEFCGVNQQWNWPPPSSDSSFLSARCEFLICLYSPLLSWYFILLLGQNPPSFTRFCFQPPGPFLTHSKTNKLPPSHRTFLIELNNVIFLYVPAFLQPHHWRLSNVSCDRRERRELQSREDKKELLWTKKGHFFLPGQKQQKADRGFLFDVCVVSLPCTQTTAALSVSTNRLLMGVATIYNKGGLGGGGNKTIAHFSLLQISNLPKSQSSFERWLDLLALLDAMKH